MRPLIAKIKPATGFSRTIYITLNIILPLLVFALVRMHFVQLALAIVLLSKWRMFAVRPRFWPAHIRANAVDIIVGVSIVTLMVYSSSQLMQFALTAIYALWLVVLKPASTTLMVSLQAMVGMFFGLVALFVGWGSAPLVALVIATGLICYWSARHFFDSFDEPYAKLLAYMWGYFGAAVVWVCGHWLLFYSVIAQPVILLLGLGYGLATLYYLDHRDRLSHMLRRQFIFIMIAIALIMLVSLIASGGNKIV